MPFVMAIYCFECILNHIASFFCSFLDTSLKVMYGIIVIKKYFSMHYRSSIPSEDDENLGFRPQIIRIHHECEGGIEKQSVPMTTDWHCKACQVMANGDHEGRNFISHPHTYTGFYFLLTTLSFF